MPAAARQNGQHDHAALATPAQDPAGKPLSERERRFVEHYFLEPIGQKAAEAAGYAPGNSAKVQASVLLTRPNVVAALDRLRAERSERVQSDGDKIIRELEGIAESDLIDIWEEGPSAYADVPGQLRLKPLSQWPKLARRAIAGMKIKHYEAKLDRDGNVIEEPYDVMEIKFWNKVEALRMLGTHHGLRFSRTELTGKDGQPLQAPATTPQVFLIGGQRVEFQ